MRYDYKCSQCGRVQEAERPVAERDNSPVCRCVNDWPDRVRGSEIVGIPMERQYSIPIINARLVCDEGDNRIGGVGFGAKDRLEIIKQDDVLYKKKHAGNARVNVERNIDNLPSIAPYMEAAGVL